MLALGVGATVAANVAYGLAFGPLGAVISAWPAVAFIGSAEMAIGIVRRARSGALASAPALSGGAHPVRTRGTAGTRSRAAPGRRARRVPATAEDAEREFMADLASGTVPSLRSIRARMQCRAGARPRAPGAPGVRHHPRGSHLTGGSDRVCCGAGLSPGFCLPGVRSDGYQHCGLHGHGEHGRADAVA
jgi:hypothetical protein